MPSVFTILISLYLANKLSKVNYGHYVYFLTFGTIVVDVVGKISVQPVLRYASEYVQNKRYLLSFVISYSLISSILLCIIFFPFGLGAVSVYIAGRIFIINYASYYQSFKKINTFSLILFLESGLQFLFLILMVKYFQFDDVVIYFYLFAATSFAVFLICILTSSFLSCKEYLQDLKLMQADSEFIRKMFSFGIRISLWFIFSNLLIQGDKFILKWFYSIEDVAQYNIAYMFYFGGVNLAFVPIISYFHPQIMTVLGMGSKSEYKKIKNQWIVVVVAVSFGTFLFMLTGVDRFFYHLIAPKFSYDLLLNIYMAIAGVLWNIAMLCQKPREFKNELRHMFAFLGVSFIIMVIGTGLVVLFGLSWMFLLPIKILALLVYIILIR